jgi:hypothetical protein
MSAMTAAGAYRPVAPPSTAVLRPLVGHEARRLLLHPIFLVGLAVSSGVFVFTAFADESHRDVIGAVTSMPTFFAGVLGLFAANLVTTRDRRAGAGELLAPLPGREHDRTRALIVASLLPAVATLVLVLAFHTLYRGLDFYADVPGAGLVLQTPVTVLGGCLLGVLAGRWAPTRTAAVLLVVAMVAFNVWTEGDVPERRLFGFMTSWLQWSTATPNKDTQLIAGSPLWHVGYLAALCGLAAVGSLLRTAPRRGRLIALGAVLAGVTVLAGIAQVG